MENFEHIEEIFKLIVQFVIMLIELGGLVVILISVVKALISFFKGEDNTRIILAQGIMLGLEFKIGSEVLRSVIVSGWTELATLGAVILIRSLLTLILHWEIQAEEKRVAKKNNTTKS